MEGVGRYSKFIVALLFAVTQFVLLGFNVDISPLIASILSVLAAFGVVLVPNTMGRRM